MTISVDEQSDGTYKAYYTAEMVMIEEIARVASIYRSHRLMEELRFVCTLTDDVIKNHVIGEEEAFAFNCAKWTDGNDIFVFERADIDSTGLVMTYKLNPVVIRKWYNSPTLNVKEALMQPMAMFPTLNKSIRTHVNNLF